jgi:MFS family permease
MTSPSTPTTPARLSMTQVLLCGAFIVTLSMGIRHGFGLWLQPITMERGWSRETFAFAIAVQNLMWGISGPFAGMLADRFGAFKVLVAGSVLYAVGLVLMGLATRAWPSPAAPVCCWAWRRRAPLMRSSMA